jgi:hypothetical protein
LKKERKKKNSLSFPFSLLRFFLFQKTNSIRTTRTLLPRQWPQRYSLRPASTAAAAVAVALAGSASSGVGVWARVFFRGLPPPPPPPPRRCRRARVRFSGSNNSSNINTSDTTLTTPRRRRRSRSPPRSSGRSSRRFLRGKERVATVLAAMAAATSTDVQFFPPFFSHEKKT